MKQIFIALFSLLFTGVSAQQQAYYQQFADYKMEIDVDAPNFTYQGKQTLTYTNNSPDELKTVYFHLYWNAFKPGSMMDQRVQNQGKNGDSRLQKDGVSRLASIPKNEEGAQNIHWIKQNGKNLKFEIQGTIMKVELAQSIRPNSSTKFEMEWDAVIPMQIRRAGRINREGIDMTMTQWYPKIAEYDYDGWATFDYIGREFHAPFSDYDVTIKIDPHYVIGAGGVLQNPNSVPGYNKVPLDFNVNSKAVWKWSAKNILDFAWAADRDYTVESFQAEQGPMVYYVYQKSEKTKFWEETKPYISRFFKVMEQNFGKYPYSAYSFIQGGDGGMEYGMCTMILGEAKSLEGLLGLMVHEGGHSWNQQIMAYNESMRPWMDEGFTSYYEDLVMNEWFPNKENKNPFSGNINAYINFTKKGIEEPAVWLGDHHDNGTAYTYASYIKGELYLVELGYILGEENLKASMKEFFETWKLKHPSDRDLLHILQKNSGMDLKWFHNYWINSTKTIDYGIKSAEADGKSTKITFINNGTVPMPIDFSVQTKSGIQNYHIPLSLTHVWKKTDSSFENFKTLNYWPWTQKEFTVTVPVKKSDISSVIIDASGRLADVNPADNTLAVSDKQ